MRTFAAVGELASFTRAAERLDISRAVASSQVGELERHLGVRLFNRTTRRVALTADGTAYLERCRRILAEIDAAEEGIRSGRARPQGRLRASVPIAFGRHLLVPALPQFTARYPGLALELQFDDRLVDLAAEQIDVAIRLGRSRAPDVIARRICATRFITCASPGYLARAGRPTTPLDLRHHRLIGFSAGGRTRRWTFQRGTERMQPALPFALAFNIADAQLACALRDQGVLQTVDLLLIHEIRAGRLEQILEDWTAPGPAMAAVYPSAHRHSAKVRVFADFAADLLTRLRTEFDAAA